MSNGEQSADRIERPKLSDVPTSLTMVSEAEDTTGETSHVLCGECEEEIKIVGRRGQIQRMVCECDVPPMRWEVSNVDEE